MKIKTYIMAWRNNPNTFLTQWLQTHNLDWDLGSQEWGIDVARNQSVNRFLREEVEKGYTHLMMIDTDIVPIIDSNYIISTKEELVWCAYSGRGGTAGHVKTFGAGCFKVSSEALKKITNGNQISPFIMTYNEKKDKLLECECDYFARLAKQNNIVPKRIGTVGHILDAVWFPNEKNKSGVSFMWQHQLPYSKINWNTCN